jgi:hypothetical protein
MRTLVSKDNIYDIVATSDSVFTCGEEALIMQWQSSTFELLKSFSGNSRFES